jgi:predicted DNA-binding protein with PD1-like motif
MIVLTVQPGQELMATLTAALLERQIASGAIVSLIGAVDEYEISTMDHHDPHRDLVTRYVEPAEFTGTGEIIDGTVHLHVVAGAQGDHARAGHLHSAIVRTFFVRAYIIPM